MVGYEVHRAGCGDGARSDQDLGFPRQALVCELGGREVAVEEMTKDSWTPAYLCRVDFRSEGGFFALSYSDVTFAHLGGER